MRLQYLICIGLLGVVELEALKKKEEGLEEGSEEEE